MKGTWSLLRKALPDLLLVIIFAGQLVCAAARGNEQILKSFSSTDGASQPAGGLIEDGNGVLYGVTGGSGAGGGAVFAINPDGSGFKVLHDFGSSTNDATSPAAPLVLGVDGGLYGTSGGGSNGVGAIFTVRPDGTGYKVLYSFGTLPQDGMTPQAPLVQVGDGTLYGATYSGGGSNMGTVFGLRPDGTGYRVLHAFKGSPNDGAWPFSGLMLGKDGALYGTTRGGGTSNTINNPFGYGAVFKLNTDGSGFTLLHSFGTSNGSDPQGALFQGNDGALYGTAGNVFRLNPDGSGYLVIPTVNNGTIPDGGLVQATDGSLYGVTYKVAFGGKEAVFKVNPDGTGYGVVHVFVNSAGLGLGTSEPLLLGVDGALYGTTYTGGNSNLGTVFRLTTMPTPLPPFVLSIVPAAGGSVNIGFVGIVGTNYSLYASTNLSDWVLQGAVSNETGIVEFLDWNITRFPQRFYRAISMPH